MSCIFSPATSFGDQIEDEMAGFVAGIDRSGILDEMLAQSNALEGVEPPAANAFRDQLILALTRLYEAERNNVFEDADEPTRRMAVALAKAFITGLVKTDNVGEAMAVIALGTSLPREIVAEGLLQAIAAQDDPAAISTPYNDLMRYVYNQSAPSFPMDPDPVASELGKVDAGQRDKIIVHLLAYDAEQTFRAILESRHEALKDPASLSWFDRRQQEARWAARHKVKLDPAFREQLHADFQALFKHEVWWVRLYALEMIGEVPTRVDDATLRRLANDENRYVKARARAILKNQE